ncbi:unnamed protein product [Ectocarpus sp. 12 AP-2014]
MRCTSSFRTGHSFLLQNKERPIRSRGRLRYVSTGPRMCFVPPSRLQRCFALPTSPTLNKVGRVPNCFFDDSCKAVPKCYNNCYTDPALHTSIRHRHMQCRRCFVWLFLPWVKVL